MKYRLIHNNTEVINIIEATGITCSNGNEIVDGTIEELSKIISDLNLTNSIPLTSFQQ